MIYSLNGARAIAGPGEMRGGSTRLDPAQRGHVACQEILLPRPRVDVDQHLQGRHLDRIPVALRIQLNLVRMPDVDFANDGRARSRYKAAGS